MKVNFFLKIVLVIVKIQYSYSEECGCMYTRECYKKMIEELRDSSEVNCIDEAGGVGTSSVMVFLAAVQKYCPEYVTVYDDFRTYERRNLYEVIVHHPDKSKKDKKEVPVILIDAGQEGDDLSVSLALTIIQQLVACQEVDMVTNMKWVILPLANPDGLEYSRSSNKQWRKNVKPAKDGISFGVDITRNFESKWSQCERPRSGFSPTYPGENAGCEAETIFITKVIERYKNVTKLYVSLRGNGHGIFYPFASTKTRSINSDTLMKVAALVTDKINDVTRSILLQNFVNSSLNEVNGKDVCGSSVDYAHNAGIKLAYEMRTFFGECNKIIDKIQKVPENYEKNLRGGYLSGFQQFYNYIIAEEKNNSLNAPATSAPVKSAPGRYLNRGK